MARQIGSHRSRSILRSEDVENERPGDLEATVRRLLEQLGEDAKSKRIRGYPSTGG